MQKQRIAILGTGEVGRQLGKAFVELGHEVQMGSRTREKAEAWAKEAGGRASGGTFAEAAAFGEVVVLATLWSATEAVVGLTRDALAGKVVVDVTNPLVFGSGGPSLALGHTDSGGEQVQRWLPKSKVVKAFNTVGNRHMFRPSFEGGPPDMFICGDDEGARNTVAGICRDFGWGVVDLGGIDASRLLEPMCILWVRHGARTGTWNHAFKLLRK